MPIRENIGQHQTIANAISRNLDNYDSDQILFELLQNADDADATTVSFVLDLRTHASTRTFGGRMPELQGPALMCYNDQIFRSEHFKGLFEFGKGSKRYDATKTGKFGLGFNSVYHLTEVPSFVSDKYWVVLDPQRKYFPGLSSPLKQPGMRVEPMREDAENLADQFSPFSANVDTKITKSPLHARVNGTMFRFPLRTKEQASTSEIRKTFVDRSKILQLFEHFKKNAREALLFLHSVCKVEIAEIDEKGQRRVLFAIRLEGDVKHRKSVRDFIKDKLEIWSKKNEGKDYREYPEALRETISSISKKEIPRHTMKFSIHFKEYNSSERKEIWWVRQGVGLQESWTMACEKNGKRQDSLNLFPSASVAVVLGKSVKGRAFATLPTPIETGYPLHVNARWCLSDNRNNLLGINDIESQRVEQRWNRVLIKDAIGNLWIELIEELQQVRGISELSYYSYFPRTSRKLLWCEILPRFYSIASERRILKSSSTSSRYLTISEARFTHSCIPLPTDSRDSRRSWLAHVLRHTWKRHKEKRTLASIVKLYLSWIREERGSILMHMRRELRVSYLTSPPFVIFSEFRKLGLGKEMSPCDLRRVLGRTNLSKIKMPSSSNVWVKWCISDLDSQRLGDLAHVVGVPIEVSSRGHGNSVVRIGTKTSEAKKEKRRGSTRRVFAGFFRGSTSSFFSQPLRTKFSSTTKSTTYYAWIASPVKNSSPKTFTVHKEEDSDHGWLSDAERISEAVAFKNGIDIVDDRKSNQNDVINFHSTKNIKAIYLETSNSDENIFVAPSSATLSICTKLLPNEKFASRSCLKYLIPWASNCGDSLNLVKFSGETITRFMDKIFPKEWKNKDFVRIGSSRRIEISSGMSSSQGPSNSKKQILREAKSLDLKLRQLSRDAQGHHRELVKNLYTFLNQTSSTRSFLDSPAVETWPLIPCVASHDSILIPPRNRKMIMRAPFDGSGHIRTMTPSEKRIWSILDLLGVPTLDEQFNLPFDTSGELNGVNLIRTLSLFERSDMCITGIDSLEAEQKRDILSYIETYAMDLSDDSLNLLRSLPLFQVIERGDVARYVNISSKKYQYHSLPYNTAPQTMKRFLTFKSSSNLKILHGTMLEIAPKLLVKLQVTVLKFGNFMTEFIFPVIGEMPRRHILDCVRFIEEQFQELCSSDNTHFEENVFKLKWVECDDGVFRAAKDLFDPTVSLFLNYFDRKSRFPPIWMPRDMFDFLRTLGMRTTMNEQTLLDCAYFCGLEGSEAKCENILTYLARNYEDYSSNLFFNVFSTLPIVPCRIARDDVHRDTVTLIRNETTKIHFTTSSLNLTFVLTEEATKNISFVEIGAEFKIKRTSSNVLNVFGYDLKFEPLSSAFFDILVEDKNLIIRIDEQEAVTSKLSRAIPTAMLEVKIDTNYVTYGVVRTSIPSRSLLLQSRSICSAYDFAVVGSQIPCMKWSYTKPTFYSRLRKLLSMRKPTIKNVVHHLNFLCERGGSIRDIERVYNTLNDSLVYTKSADLKEMLFNKRVLLLADGKRFVAPNSVFVYLSENVTPYAIDRADLAISLRAKSHFLSAFGVGTRHPQLTEITSWLEDLKRKHADNALATVDTQFDDEDSDLALSFRIVQLYVRTAKNEEGNLDSIYVPNTERVLRKSNTLFFNDAPWLDERLDKSKIPIVHSTLLKHVPSIVLIDSIGIRPLSSSLKEHLLPGTKLMNTTNLREVSQWTKNINSNFFRSGLRRLMQHESSAVLSSKIISVLCSLHTLKLVSVSHLRTAFSLNGKNVTSNNNTIAAAYLVDRAKMRIFLSTRDVHPQRALMSLAMALNELFFGSIKNLLAVEKMLSLNPPSEIPELLSFLRISQGVDDVFLGTELTSASIQRLTPFQVENATVHQDVVFKDEYGSFCYGRLLGVRAGEVIEVETAKNKTQRFAVGNLFVIRTRDESRREDIHLEEEKEHEEDVKKEDEEEDELDIVVTTIPSPKEPRVSSPRVLYTPPQTDWWESEKQIMQNLEKENERAEQTLEPALPGVNTLLRKAVKIDSEVANVSISSTIRPGHDLVRFGNFRETIDVLKDVCDVFSYNYKYITLFYQPDAISRFNKQKILINIEPVEKHRQKYGLEDIRKHPFAYTYIYGLLIHKLAHFHDAVHGTRHAFFMEELRIEFIEAWIDMLARRGFDASALEASGEYDMQLWGTQF